MSFNIPITKADVVVLLILVVLLGLGIKIIRGFFK